MNVLDVMTFYPVTIHPNASLAEALGKMKEVGCHHLPVISNEKHLIGVLSFHDCQQALGDPLREKGQLHDEALARSLLVSHAMTPAPVIIEADAPAHEAGRLMLEQYIGCLPVMRGETLIGIVTRSDLMMAFMHLSQHIAGQTAEQKGHSFSSFEKKSAP